MMVSCPKCGFQQPDDQYCAQCGVDMKAFVPAPEPMTSRLSKNITLQIILAGAIIAGLIASIYFSQKENIQETLKAAFESPSPEADSEITWTASSDEEKSAGLEARALTPDSNEVSKPAATSTAKKSASTPTSLIVDYIEVPEPLLQAWVAEGQTLSETGNSRSILLANTGGIEGLKRQEWRAEDLGEGASLPFTNSKSVKSSVLGAVQGFNSELGLSIEITPSVSANQTLDMEIDIAINLPIGMDDQATPTTITGRYSIPSDTILVIVGLIPRQSMRAEVQNAFSGGPLGIFESADFLSGASEFAIVIRPE